MSTTDITGAAGRLRRAFFDRLIGPAAGTAEVGLALGAGLTAALLIPALAHARGADWSAAQLVVSGLLAFPSSLGERTREMHPQVRRAPAGPNA